MKSEKGFSLVELLVVVIIIAIVAAIAIPNLLASRRAANEASAISSLRTIHSAEVTYFSTSGTNTTYGVLGSLSGAGLIDTTLGGGTKSGYTFTSSLGTATYCAEAHPTTAGTTGDRFFAVSTPGVIYSATAVFTCGTGTLSGGTGSAAIQ